MYRFSVVHPPRNNRIRRGGGVTCILLYAGAGGGISPLVRAGWGWPPCPGWCHRARLRQGRLRRRFQRWPCGPSLTETARGGRCDVGRLRGTAFPGSPRNKEGKAGRAWSGADRIPVAPAVTSWPFLKPNVALQRLSACFHYGHICVSYNGPVARFSCLRRAAPRCHISRFSTALAWVSAECTIPRFSDPDPGLTSAPPAGYVIRNDSS